MINKLNIFIFSLFAFCISSTVSAAMIVEKSVVHFQPNEPQRQDIEIFNPDKAPLYIDVETLLVKNPGESSETRTIVRSPKESNFLITPKKLIIEPGQRKRIRLLNTAPLNDKERVIRVNLKPISPELEVESTAIKVLIGYQLLVLIQPKTPKPDIVSNISGDKLTLTNNGNTNVLLHRGKQCPTKTKEKNIVNETQCSDLITKRLYPGNSLTLDIKKGFSAQYILSSGTANQYKVF